MRITRSIHEPIRGALTFEQRWNQDDQGLVHCWERGRVLSAKDPALAAQAQNGELVPLNWKGGVEKALKKRWKYGTLFYLATWQGLRGDSLDIDLTDEPRLVCTANALTVIFTNDYEKYANA